MSEHTIGLYRSTPLRLELLRVYKNDGWQLCVNERGLLLFDPQTKDAKSGPMHPQLFHQGRFSGELEEPLRIVRLYARELERMIPPLEGAQWISEDLWRLKNWPLQNTVAAALDHLKLQTLHDALAAFCAAKLVTGEALNKEVTKILATSQVEELDVVRPKVEQVVGNLTPDHPMFPLVHLLLFLTKA